MDDMFEEKIGEGLVRMNAMTQEQVDDVLERQKKGNDSLFGIIALELGYVDDTVLLEYLETREL